MRVAILSYGTGHEQQQRPSKKGSMLKITRATNATVIFSVSGRLDSENLTELKTLISAEGKGQHIVLDLNELTLVDEEAVRFLEGTEVSGIELKNCPPYIREWITRERGS
jgi:hypothetical protein